MALQTKTYSVACDKNYTLYLKLTENSTSTSGNSSSVSYELYLQSSDYNFSGYSCGYHVTLNGSDAVRVARSGSPQKSISKNSTLTLASGTKTIKHDSSGSKTMSFSFGIDMSGSITPGTHSSSGNMTLTKINLYSKMGAPTITQSGSTKRGGTITFSWKAGSLGNSTVSGYSVYVGTSSTPTYSDKSASTTSISYTVPKTAVGTTIYFSIIQKSAAGSSYNSNAATKNVNSTTNVPTISLVSYSPSNKLISSKGTKITVKLSATNNAGTGKYQWKKTYSSGDTDWINISGATASTLTYTETLTSGKTIRFKCSDGYEDSSTKSITYSLNIAPVINNFDLNTSFYDSTDIETTKPMLKTFTVQNVNTSKESYNTVSVYLRSNNVDSLIYGPSSTLPTNLLISNVFKERGAAYTIGISVNDGTDDSEIKWDDNIYEVPKNDKNSILTESKPVKKTAGYTVFGMLLKNGEQNISFTPSLVKDNTKTVKYMLYRQITSGQILITESNYTSGEVSITDSFDNLAEEQSVQYTIRLLNEYGDENDYSFNYQIIKKPDWSGQSIIFNGTTFKVKGTQLNPKISGQPSMSGAGEINKYETYYIIPNGNEDNSDYIVSLGGINTESGTSNYPFLFDNFTESGYQGFINKIWDEKEALNATVSSQFKVVAINSYGLSSDIIATIDTDFRVAPVFLDNLVLKVYCQQDGEGEIGEQITTNNKRVIGGEWVHITAKSTDENTQDQITYSLLYANSNDSSTIWQTTDKSETKKQGEQVVLKYQMPELVSADTVDYYFKVIATDSTGLSTEKLCSNKLQLANTTLPNINLLSTIIEGTQIKASFNSLSSIPNSSMFNNRVYTGSMTKKIILEKSTSSDFSSIAGSTIDETFNQTELTIDNNESEDKYYIRIRVECETGKKNNTEASITQSVSNILVVYNIRPVVSYRQKGIGIFKKDWSPDDDTLMHISRSDNTHKEIKIGSGAVIKIEDESESIVENKITIDGFIIDCGSY